MELFTIASIVIALSALFGYINVKLLKLPNTIGLMVIAIVFTLVLFASSMFTNTFLTAAHHLICLLYTSPSPRDLSTSRMPSSA